MTNTPKKFTQVTLFRNKNKKELSKSFEIVSGSVVKNTSANMVDGAYETQAIGDLCSFAAAISRGEIGADTAFAYGVARADLPRTGRVATKKRCGSSAIARTAENFCWRTGEPGVLMCDFDPPRDGRLNSWTPEDYHKLLYDVAPELRDAEMAFTPSASARVLRDGEPVGHGWRGYAIVSDAACIPIYGEMLFRRLVEAGLGWIDISSSGAQLLRTIIDASVWQPNRLDFVGRPAIKGAGLQLARSEPVMFGQAGRPLVMRPDGVALRQWRRTSPIVQNLLGTTAKEAEKQGRRWENERVAAAVASGEQSEARARASYSAARKRGVLGPDFVIYAHNGRAISVRDILANPRRWHGAAVRHPLEPETGGADYTKIYTEGQARYPVITSLAHGGQTWRLTSAHLAIPSSQKGNAGATDHPGITGIDKEGRLHSNNAARETSMTEIHATLESPMKVTTTSESPMKVTAISEPPMKEIHATSEPQMKEIHANGFGVNAQAQTDVFERDEKGRILKNERNVCAALKMSGIALSYNEFSCEYCVSGLDGYSAVDDNAVDEMYLMLHREYDLKPSFEDFFRIIKAEARRRKFDPLTEYLDRVESEWDGVPRIDEWLHAYMGAENTPLNGAFGAKHLIAAVRRARHPGCKYDTMLVLEGAQRSGKSSCVRMLCPDEDLFTDALLIGAPIKEVREATQGKWLVELAELDGMSRKEASTVKAMLSRQSDSARMAYDRLQSSIKRRFVMWGTCNESNYLRDATGNRRFWPVTVGGIDPTGAIQAIIRDRDLLWGEAAARERSGESLELPDDLGGEAREAQEERLEIDPWEETIASYASSREWVSTSEIYGPDVLDIATERQNPAVGKRVAAIFTRIGWKRVRRTIGGRRIWGYIPAHLAP